MADRLKVQKTTITNVAGATCMTGVSGDSQTVLSISICNTSANDETFHMLHTASGGGSGYYIYHTQSLPAKSTFIHNDKIILLASEELWIESASDPDDTDGIHVVVSYLDQDD